MDNKIIYKVLKTKSSAQLIIRNIRTSYPTLKPADVELREAPAGWAVWVNIGCMDIFGHITAPRA